MKHIYVFLVSFLFLTSAMPAAATCSGAVGGGIPDVTVTLLTEAADGTRERREHVFISQDLAAALDLAIVDREDLNPQVRVTVDAVNDVPVGLPIPTVNFTVFTTTPDQDCSIRVYAQEPDEPGEVDEDSGEWKLLNLLPAGTAVTDLSVHVRALAPSSTHFVDADGSTHVDQHFIEPNPVTAVPGAPGVTVDRHFFEIADVNATDQQVAVLVPHGGDIEFLTSEMGADLLAELRSQGIGTDLWDAVAFWDEDDGEDDDDVSERFHITSGSVHPDSFPGLAALFALPHYATDRPYRYSVAYHGMRLSTPGIVVGGQSNLDEKCYATRRIQDALGADAGEIAFYLWDVDDNGISLPDRRGLRLEAERSVRSIRGLSDDNVVNRLSPNEDGDPGFGAFQLELSNGLRDEQHLLDGVTAGISTALVELLADPTVADRACHVLRARTHIEVSADEIPDILVPPTDTMRREHAWITSGLAAVLGIETADVDPGGVDSPQIRVVADRPRAPGGIANSGAFTVTNIVQDPALKVLVYAPNDPDDDVAGSSLLTNGLKIEPRDLTRVLVTRPVPSYGQVVFVDDDGDSETMTVRGASEPEGQYGMIWGQAVLKKDRQLLLALPFAGDSLSLWDTLASVRSAAESDGDRVSQWIYRAGWLYDRTEDRWRVSPRSFGEGRGFPVLDTLLDEIDRDTGQPFRYVLSPESFPRWQRDVVITGQASADEKCFLIQGMRQGLSDADLGSTVAFFLIGDPDDWGTDWSFFADPFHWVPQEVAREVSWMDPDDIRHRLSANPDQDGGRGNFTVFLSTGLLAQTAHRDALADGLGDALRQLVDNGLPAGFTCSSLL